MLSWLGIKFGKQDPWVITNCVSCAKHHQMSLLALLALDVQHEMHAHMTSCMFSTCSKHLLHVQHKVHAHNDLLHVQHKVHVHMVSWLFSTRYMHACSHDLLDVQHKAHACMTSWMFSTYSKKLLDVQHIFKKTTVGCSAQGACLHVTWTLGCSAQGACSHDLLDGQHKVYAHMTSWVSSTRYMLISQKEKHQVHSRH